MEPLGIAASLLTALEATAGVSKATIALYRNVRDAPKELEYLANQISRTQIRLDVQVKLYQGLNVGYLANWITDDALKAFLGDLENAKTCLDSVRNIIPASADYSSSKHRFSWVAHDKRKVNKVLDNLRNIDGNLSAMLGTLSVALSLRSNELIADLHKTQLSLAAQLQSSPRTMGKPSGSSLAVKRTITTQRAAHGSDIVRSPLQEACQYGHVDIARLLLANGAFLEHTSFGGHTAFTMLWLQSSLQFSKVDFLRILLAYSPLASVLDASKPGGPFACAAMKGNAEELELLMSSGVRMEDRANTNARIASQVIKYSILNANIATFDFLVSSLSREWIDEVDPLGRGYLHAALNFPSPHVKEIVKRLLDAGADVHLRNVHGYEPGDYARACDARTAHSGKWKPGVEGNVQAFCGALLLSGFDVEVDQDNRLWWPSQDHTGISGGNIDHHFDVL
ncbi:MAG: hypothetical protein Q9169_000032 [Polycauliona sp. 2 TL-2023]